MTQQIIFVGQTLNSYKEFEEVTLKFEKESGFSLKTRSSRKLFMNNDEEIQQNFKFSEKIVVCEKKDINKNKNRSLYSKQYFNCPVEISIKLDKDRKCFVVVVAKLIHDHTFPIEVVKRSAGPLPTPEFDLELPPGPALEPEHEPALEPNHESALEPNLEPAHEPAHEPEDEPALELSHEPALEVEHEPTLELNLEPNHEAALEPNHEHALEPILEPNHEPALEPEHEPTLERNLAPHHEHLVERNLEPALEPNHEPAPIPQMKDNEANIADNVQLEIEVQSSKPIIRSVAGQNDKDDMNSNSKVMISDLKVKKKYSQVGRPKKGKENTATSLPKKQDQQILPFVKLKKTEQARKLLSWFLLENDVVSIINGCVKISMEHMSEDRISDSFMEMDETNLLLIKKYFDTKASFAFFQECILKKKNEGILTCGFCSLELGEGKDVILCDHCLIWSHMFCYDMAKPPSTKFWFCGVCRESV